jgi:hypothetical protein
MNALSPQKRGRVLVVGDIHGTPATKPFTIEGRRNNETENHA